MNDIRLFVVDRSVQKVDIYFFFVLKELVKMFTDTESFYYSPTGDLTNSIQRQCYQQKRQLISEKPLWSRVDERFFWNQHMLQELIETEVSLIQLYR